MAVLLTALALTACGDDSDGGATAATSGPAASPATAASPTPAAAADAPGDPAPAAAAGKSTPACPKGLAFDLAKDWKPKAVADGETLLDVGSNHPVCEVDAKPAGLIGFIRVYVSPAEPRKALEAQVAGDKGATKVTYRDAKVGTGTGVEASWTDAEDAPSRAFAVKAGAGSVLLVWGGLDAEEHTGGLPAYVLARRTAVPL